MDSEDLAPIIVAGIVGTLLFGITVYSMRTGKPSKKSLLHVGPGERW